MPLFQDVTDTLGLTNYGAGSEAAQNAAAAFNGITMPELTPIQLQQLVSAGELTPEQANEIILQQSSMKDIYVDPRLKEAQMSALAGMQDMAENKGLTAADKAQLADIALQEETAQRGSREAILQGARSRGVGGSGLEMLANLQNQQESASRSSQRDTQVAGMAQQRAMEALQNAGPMGGQMRGQAFGEESAKAQASDAIAKFNAANRQQLEQSNVASRNAAQAQNLSERQRQSDANTAIANQQRQYNQNLPQQQYQNQLALASGKSGAQGNLSQFYNQQAQTGMGGLSGLASAGALMYMASDKNVKQDVQQAPDEVDSFLNDLTGYKYSYKDPEKYGQGERLGVMAQDMEKSNLGSQSVEEGQDGVKMINEEKTFPAILASIARLNDRLNKMEGV
jgi:hypothetical protein